MNYMVTKKGFARALFTIDSYDEALNFIKAEVMKQVLAIDYTESENDRYEEFDYMFEQYEVTFG